MLWLLHAVSLPLKWGSAACGSPDPLHAGPGHQQPRSCYCGGLGTTSQPHSQRKQINQVSERSQGLRTWQLNIAECCEVLMSWWLDSISPNNPKTSSKIRPLSPLPCTLGSLREFSLEQDKLIMIIVIKNRTSVCANGVDTTGSFPELLGFTCMALKYMKTE